MTIEVGTDEPHCRKCGGRQSPKTGKVMKAKIAAFATPDAAAGYEDLIPKGRQQSF
jgi:hypothetical protein